jgi:hypothetical protein
VSKTDIMVNLNEAAKYGITFPDELLNDPDVIKVKAAETVN